MVEKCLECAICKQAHHKQRELASWDACFVPGNYAVVDCGR